MFVLFGLDWIGTHFGFIPLKSCYEINWTDLIIFKKIILNYFKNLLKINK